MFMLLIFFYVMSEQLLSMFGCCFTEHVEVHSFLLANMENGGILELLMHYLKAIGQRFLEEWPSGLSGVVMEIYNCWRRHSAGLPNPLLRDSNNQHIKVGERKTWSNQMQMII